MALLDLNAMQQVIIGLDTAEMISEMEALGHSEIDFGIDELDDEDSDFDDDDDEEEDEEDEDDDDCEDDVSYDRVNMSSIHSCTSVRIIAF